MTTDSESTSVFEVPQIDTLCGKGGNLYYVA